CGKPWKLLAPQRFSLYVNNPVMHIFFQRNSGDCKIVFQKFQMRAACSILLCILVFLCPSVVSSLQKVGLTVQKLDRLPDRLPLLVCQLFYICYHNLLLTNVSFGQRYFPFTTCPSSSIT